MHKLDEQKMADNFEKEYQRLVCHVLKSTGNKSMQEKRNEYIYYQRHPQMLR